MNILNNEPADPLDKTELSQQKEREAVRTGEQKPKSFKRPLIIIAAALVGAFAVLGVVLSVKTLTSGGEQQTATSRAAETGEGKNNTAEAATDSKEDATKADSDADSGSVCGLRPVKMEGTLDRSPKIKWEYAGTTAFPVSEEFGPAAVNDDGIKYCFARTPEGAALAAAAGAGYFNNQETLVAWYEQGMLPGPVKDELLANHTQLSNNNGSSRVTISAFRLLSYDGNTAKVDVAGTVSIYGRNTYVSYVYPLVWSDGDWKVDFPESFLTGEGAAVLQNLSGYVHWSDSE